MNYLQHLSNTKKLSHVSNGLFGIKYLQKQERKHYKVFEKSMESVIR